MTQPKLTVIPQTQPQFRDPRGIRLNSLKGCLREAKNTVKQMMAGQLGSEHGWRIVKALEAIVSMHAAIELEARMQRIEKMAAANAPKLIDYRPGSSDGPIIDDQ